MNDVPAIVANHAANAKPTTVSSETNQRVAFGTEPSASATALAASQGTVVNVSNNQELQQALNNRTSDMTVVLEPGEYQLSRTLYIKDVDNFTIRGATNNAADVVLLGNGMTNPDYGSTPSGIWVGNSANVQIANMTIRDFYFHPIILNAGAESPHLYNLRLIDAGEQFVKSNPDGSGGGNDSGLVEQTTFEYTSTARSWYLGAIDVHTGDSWIIRNNEFRNIRPPEGVFGGTTIRMWNYSSNTIIEGNKFLNCQYGIALGLQPDRPYDHRGGIVRNNFFHRSSDQDGDVAIVVNHSPDTQVLHNTILLNGTYKNAIEYRFQDTTGTVIKNNLTDAAISSRDGANGLVSNNVTTAADDWFANAASGDFHLNASATAAIDQAEALANAMHDFDGDARPIGGGADIGADEYLPPASDGSLNLHDFSIDSYGGSGQDVTGTAQVDDSGSTLSISGNRWLKIDLPYQITADTVLEFDFRSSVEGEIHGIGFDNDLEISSDRTFRLWGSQDWGISDYADDGTLASESRRYTIPVGQFYQGNVQHLFFVNDHDVAAPTAESKFANIKIYEDTVNFGNFSIDPYGEPGQDVTGEVNVEDGGRTLRMVGNRWLKIDLPYQVTRNTVLEFDFNSSAEGEIHGIGFDNDLAISSDRTFRLFGSQNWGISDFADYKASAPSTRRYTIPVGQYYEGNFNYLFFVADHDVTAPTAESVFSNLRILEKT